MPTQKNKYLVFSSVGDYHALDHWTHDPEDGKKDFDLWVAHYGDHKLSDDLEIDFCMDLKGAKFPNLKTFCDRYGDVMKQYDAIAVLDDDLIISASEISALFAIRDTYDLWLLQPAFAAAGKISHTVTRAREDTLLRTTNFVEVTCPFFRTDKLLSFMAIYDPVLVGFGIDWWYLDHLQAPRDKIAIVDAIPCTNPLDTQKPEGREIDRLQSLQHRMAHWEQVKKAHGIENERRFVGYGEIPNQNNKQEWLEWVCKSEGGK
jgi:hypothetical protein